MQTPNFGQYQFLDAAAFNTAMAMLSANVNGTVSGVAYPGLIHPEAVSLTPAGLAVTVQAPLPFQVMFGDGHVAAASGTVTNTVTSTYNVSFSGVVPVSGTATAYLLVSGVNIGLVPVQVVGPQQGHPDYNPNFIPYTLYTETANSVNFIVTTTPADGYNTFEVARTTLAAAATGVSLSTIYQQRSSSYNSTQIVQASGAVPVTAAAHGGRVLEFTAAGTATLPLAATSNGVVYTFTTQYSGTNTIQVTAPDIGYGLTNTTWTSFSITQGQSVALASIAGFWQVLAGSPNLVSTGALGLSDGGLQSAPFTAANGFIYDVDNTAGTFTWNAPLSGTVSRGSTFAINNIGNNGTTINWGGLNFQGDPANSFFAINGLIIFRYGVASEGWARSY